jgi:Na+-transporting NADH:ubiquinone oxidoreductase subunit C
VAKRKETVPRTIVVALALCIVCSVVVSAAAVMLRPAQVINRNLDMKTNILAAAGMLEAGVSTADIEEQFQRFEVRLVDLKSGKYVEPQSLGLENAMAYDQYRASSDPELSEELAPSEDKAGIKSQANIAKVFILKADSDVKRVVLPIHGYGLWSTLYGFVALKGDANTIEGLGFYAHAETPGLGGEVDNPKWKAQWVGKSIYDEGEMADPQIRLVKGGIDANTADREHKVDALSGATLTSRGVQQLVNFWMGERGFAPYLKKLREGEV